MAQKREERVLEGETLGSFKLLSELGRGGMAVVYKGIQESLNRPVAIKVLPPEFSNTTELKRRFHREAEAMASFSHPNIVQIIERGEKDGVFYFAMEYVEGGSLKDLMTSPDLSYERVLDIAIQICAGLEHAHGLGIVHRDLKPGNVLVEKRTGNVKIADFGIAQFAKGTEASTLTSSMVAMGTLNYMSPEQKVDAKSVDARTDIYSLGVMLYELFTGQLPMGSFDPPSAVNKRVPREADAVVLKALKSAPSQRQQTASDLAADLRRLRAGAGQIGPLHVVRRVASALTDAASTTVRSPLGRAAGVAVFLVFIAGIYFWRTPEPAPPPPPVAVTPTPAPPGPPAPAPAPAPVPAPPAPAPEPAPAPAPEPPSPEPGPRRGIGSTMAAERARAAEAERERQAVERERLDEMRREAEDLRRAVAHEREKAVAAGAPTRASSIFGRAADAERAANDLLAGGRPAEARSRLETAGALYSESCRIAAEVASAPVPVPVPVPEPAPAPTPAKASAPTTPALSEIRFTSTLVPPGRSAGQALYAKGLAADGAGAVYYADLERGTVCKIGPDARVAWETTGFAKPYDVAIGPGGATLYVANTFDHSIVLLDAATGRRTSSFGRLGGGQGEFNLPYAVAVSRAGEVAVFDRMNKRVQRFDASGKPVGQFAAVGGNFAGLAIDAQGRIYATEGEGLKRFDPADGSVRAFASHINPVNATGLDVDEADRLFVADTRASRVIVLTTNGDRLREVRNGGDGAFRTPLDVAAGGGRLFVLDLKGARKVHSFEVR